MVKERLKEILIEQITLMNQAIINDDAIDIVELSTTQAKIKDLIDNGNFIAKMETNNISNNVVSPISNAITQTEVEDDISTEDMNQQLEQLKVAMESGGPVDEVPNYTVTEAAEPRYQPNPSHIDGTFRLHMHGGEIELGTNRGKHGLYQQVNQAFVNTNNLVNGNKLKLSIRPDKTIIVHYNDGTELPNKYLDIKCEIKQQHGKFYVDEDIYGDSIEDTIGMGVYYLPPRYTETAKVSVGDTVTLRYDKTIEYNRQDQYISCVWVDRTSYVKPQQQSRKTTKTKEPKKKSEWEFDLDGLAIGIIGGDVFHSTWKERIENNNGVMNAEAQGVKLRGLTDANQRIVDNSDIVLLSQNMINHSTANAIKKYAKQVDKPCESFEGFSANQIFRIVKSLDC